MPLVASCLDLHQPRSRIHIIAIPSAAVGISAGWRRENDSMSISKQIIIVVAAASFMASAHGQELKIGLSAEPSAMDPHFHNLTPNHSATKHIFDRLLDQDENQRIQPMLATSWKNLDDTTWEFKLRPGVKFTDGGDLTANDIIYSYCRAPRVENSPSSMALNVRAITDMKAPDPLTLIIKTADAHPVLPA